MGLNDFIEQCYEDNNGVLYNTEQLLEMVKDWEDPNPPLVIKEYDGIKVVRDDLLNHGSKIRFVDKYIRDVKAKEIVFGCCPATGYAQISLPAVANKYDKKVILFMAKRHPDNYHEYQRRGMDLGAIYEWVNMGMLSVTKSRAQKTPIMKLSNINIAIRKSLNLFLTELFTEIIQSGVINVVKRMNKIEIPSIPTL